MTQKCGEKLAITDTDTLRRRHAGNYLPRLNGEVYLLPYEFELYFKDQSFFDALSDFDFLKPQITTGDLTLKALRSELMQLNDNVNGTDFWKNFNDSALKLHLNAILGAGKGGGWRKMYLKGAGETDADKPHHNDMLKCLYLLAHLHKANPSYIRQLATKNDAWSAELRVFYPRKDFAFSEEYGAYLSELFTNILYYQPEDIRKLVKYLDKIIEKLVIYHDIPLFHSILADRSDDTDSPSLKILKYSHVASATHFQSLNAILRDKIAGDYTDLSFTELKASSIRSLATPQHYKLVAAICLRLKIGPPINNTLAISQSEIDSTIAVYSNALAADALRGLAFESTGSKSGKVDTSIASAIRKLAEQNPQTIEGILHAESIDASDVPEIYTQYMFQRTRYAYGREAGKTREVLAQLAPSPKVEQVLAYVMGNNLSKISADIEKIEKQLLTDRYLSYCGENSYPISIYEYGFHDLPDRE